VDCKKQKGKGVRKLCHNVGSVVEGNGGRYYSSTNRGGGRYIRGSVAVLKKSAGRRLKARAARRGPVPKTGFRERPA